jgi:hypothetical protein
MEGTAVAERGWLCGSDAAGLGIEIDEAAAAKSPMREAAPGDPWTIGRGVDGSLVRP